MKQGCYSSDIEELTPFYAGYPYLQYVYIKRNLQNGVNELNKIIVIVKINV